ncbi:DUF72 domain-containing protein [Chryseolinea sp. H1M3-3]|uniref:DUF72 domain-containing protein n=1 Tax=Chryseolinea sp. H1M3-3 TaxID=3034144 RepID=UPI0023EA9540|nr:DUF72 domain-containing protein [Chryseolinea sp. H1M3-3]
MEFGKVDSPDLNGIDFTLPPDPVETKLLLDKQKKLNSRTEFFVGCAKWGRKDWIGKVYPPGTKEADFLSLYARHFNCIELNATFYRIPTKSQTAAWASKVGKDFKFSPKFTDKISHLKRLKDVKELTDQFLEGISGFKDNLGPVFLMPHPGMGPKTLEITEAFIQSLPKDIELFVEFRNPQWYADTDAFKNLFSMLEKNNAGSIITDASGRRDCVHMRLTTPTAFIRFVGNGLHPTDYTRVDDWVTRIKSWMDQGIEKVYFYMHQHEEIHSPELCKYVIEQLNKRCGTNIPDIKFVEQTGSDEVIEKLRPGKSRFKSFNRT